MKLTPFGFQVRTLRMELGLTLKTMADSLEVSSAYLSSIELGDRQLSSKIAEDTLAFFSSRVSSSSLQNLREAIDKTAQMVPIDNLAGEEKILVAAFARRLTDGEGVPPEIYDWLKKGGENGSK